MAIFSLHWCSGEYFFRIYSLFISEWFGLLKSVAFWKFWILEIFLVMGTLTLSLSGLEIVKEYFGLLWRLTTSTSCSCQRANSTTWVRVHDLCILTVVLSSLFRSLVKMKIKYLSKSLEFSISYRTSFLQNFLDIGERYLLGSICWIPPQYLLQLIFLTFYIILSQMFPIQIC